MWVIIINQKQKAKAKKASVSISFTKKQKKPSSSHCQPTIGYACSFVSVHTAAVIIYGLSKIIASFCGAFIASNLFCSRLQAPQPRLFLRNKKIRNFQKWQGTATPTVRRSGQAKPAKSVSHSQDLC